jgi:hypothetical protein
MHASHSGGASGRGKEVLRARAQQESGLEPTTGGVSLPAVQGATASGEAKNAVVGRAAGTADDLPSR